MLFLYVCNRNTKGDFFSFLCRGRGDFIKLINKLITTDNFMVQ